jgi:hypothetical protein
MEMLRLPTRVGIDFSDDNMLRAVSRMLEPSYAVSLISAYKDLFFLVGVIEPRLIRMLRSKDEALSSIGHLHSYCQSILRWEPVLMRLAPDLRVDFGMIEFYYRAMHRFLQSSQDFLIVRKDTRPLLLCTATFLEDIAHMDQLAFVDTVECEAAKDVLEKQLRFRLAREFDLTKPWEMLCPNDSHALGIFSCIQSVAPCIVPRHTHIIASPARWRCYFMAGKNCQGKNDTTTTRSQCMGRVPELDKMHHEVHASQEILSCFCGWFIACLPEGLLSVLGLDAHSLSRLFHDPSHSCGMIQKSFPSIAALYHCDTAFLTSTTATTLRYSIRLTTARIFRELQSLDVVASLAKDEFMRSILSESMLLMLNFIGMCTRLEASAPESYKFLEKKSVTFVALRKVAETMYGEEIMEGLW